VQAIDPQPRRAPDGARVHYERHRPEQTTLYGIVQQHAATFFAATEAPAGSDLPQFVRDEFDAFLECGTLAHRCDGPHWTRLPGLGTLGLEVFENPVLNPQSFTLNSAALTADHLWHRWR